jgi:multiple sugar transport system ATP-binding protein
MGRAIVRSPQVFLFDEPLSNLDAGLRVQMRAEIKDLHRRLGTTSIYVTHDQVEAMTMADRIAVMRNGRIEQIGAPLDLYDRPSNSYVAGFIGSPAMNMLPGRPDAAGFLLSDGQRLVGVRGRPAAVTAGIRPEHVSVDPNGLSVDVHVVEPMGSETQIVGRLANQPFTAVLRDRIALRPGSRVNLAVAGDHVHFFDAQGARL